MKRKSEEKRVAILKAAFAAVAEHGYFETTIDDIARRAHVAKGTVYLYFKDKPDIYIGLVEWVLAQAEEIIHTIAGRPISPQRKLAQVFTTWSDTIIARPAVLSLLAHENVSLTSPVMRRFKRIIVPRLQALVADIAGIIRAGSACGQFRRVDPMAAAQLFFAAFRSAIIGASRGGQLPELSRTMQELFFRGLLADSGRGPSPKKTRSIDE